MQLLANGSMRRISKTAWHLICRRQSQAFLSPVGIDTCVRTAPRLQINTNLSLYNSRLVSIKTCVLNCMRKSLQSGRRGIAKSVTLCRRKLSSLAPNQIAMLLAMPGVSYTIAISLSQKKYLPVLICAGCNGTLEPTLNSTQMISDIFIKNNRQGYLEWLIQDVIPLALRATQLLCVFTPLLITYPLTYFGPFWFETWLRILYVAVEHSGATFIKLGQWASTRRDLFSKQVRPHPWSHTVKILKEAYGEEWQEMLHLKDGQKPVGSGCIAQVYKGYISPDIGCEDKDMKIQENKLIPVAIKVLHPSIQTKFRHDMALMKSAAQCLTWLFPKLHWISLNQCVQEFRVVMQAQLDMWQECLCLQRFTTDFAAFEDICVPKPFPKLVRHNILIETFEEGISIGDFLKDSEQSFQLRKRLANIGVNALLQMVFVNNFVHADLHPGNLLVQNIDKFAGHVTESEVQSHGTDDILEDHRMSFQANSNPRLVLLDCGITASLSPDDRQKFREVFTAVIKGDGEAVANLFLSKSSVNQCSDPELFRKEMAQLIRDARQNFVNISKIKVAELMNQVFAVMSHHHIQLEANFATIILAMAMLEGLGRSLNPELDLLDKARPVLLDSYLSTKRATA